MRMYSHSRRMAILPPVLSPRAILISMESSSATWYCPIKAKKGVICTCISSCLPDIAISTSIMPVGRCTSTCRRACCPTYAMAFCSLCRMSILPPSTFTITIIDSSSEQLGKQISIDCATPCMALSCEGKRRSNAKPLKWMSVKSTMWRISLFKIRPLDILGASTTPRSMISSPSSFILLGSGSGAIFESEGFRKSAKERPGLDAANSSNSKTSILGLCGRLTSGTVGSTSSKLSKGSNILVMSKRILKDLHFTVASGLDLVARKVK
mmetsp:Transcript_13257/g.29621  ORF Transcript_13257/g.29621 Transcript_13257/m.29621 type:complete len:267 (+) Transcript_13257:811-1611(+)